MDGEVTVNATARRELILAELVAGEVDVRALATRFDVSESTIRRDLRQLTEDGLVRRTYGGALAARAGEPTVSVKQRRNVTAKRAIARKAASWISPGDSLLLDAGTTTGLLAWELRHHRDLVVLTNGVSAMDALRDCEGIELIVVGGTLRPISQSLLGPLAERALELFTPDHVFVGVDAVEPDRGVNCPSLWHSSWKGRLLSLGRQVTILADASKLGGGAYDWWAPLPGGVRLLTDTSATDAQVRPFTEVGLDVEVAPESAVEP